MRGKKYWQAAALGVVLAAGVFGAAAWHAEPRAEQSCAQDLPPLTGLRETSEAEPASCAPLLSWDKDTQAVVYELEVYADAAGKHRLYRTRQVYTNHYQLPVRDFAADWPEGKPLYWRVRSLGFDGEPVSAYSALAVLYTSARVPELDHPVIFTREDAGNGTTLLYPVYDWVGLAGAASYEIELYAGGAGQALANGLPPVAVLHADVTELYDAEPRLGTYSWRVRALDAAGAPLGTWSPLHTFRTEPADQWEVAVLGDSISHGGGHYSFSPSDFEFSWLSYLDFPALNLSASGDLSSMTRARFLRDVLPFHPRYLMIFTGTNSLRAGEDPAHVIDDLEQMKLLALSHGIAPIFLTLPPINPKNIAHVFDEPTAPDWQARFAAVNSYILSQAHIDVAAAFVCPEGVLPTKLALDGLHPDVDGKRIIGACVNEHWDEAKRDAAEQLEDYQEERESAGR